MTKLGFRSSYCSGGLPGRWLGVLLAFAIVSTGACKARRYNDAKGLSNKEACNPWYELVKWIRTSDGGCIAFDDPAFPKEPKTFKNIDGKDIRFTASAVTVNGVRHEIIPGGNVQADASKAEVNGTSYDVDGTSVVVEGTIDHLRARISYKVPGPRKKAVGTITSHVAWGQLVAIYDIPSLAAYLDNQQGGKDSGGPRFKSFASALQCTNELDPNLVVHVTGFSGVGFADNERLRTILAAHSNSDDRKVLLVAGATKDGIGVTAQVKWGQWAS